MEKMDKNKYWGRNIEISKWNKIFCGILFVISPLLVFYFVNVAKNCNCDIWMGSSGICLFQNIFSGKNDILIATKIISIWVGFQIFLSILPDYIHKIWKSYRGGIQKGLVSPGGIVYFYNINGFQAWIISVSLFLMMGYFDFFPLKIIYDYWLSMLLVSGLLAYFIALVAYVKAYYLPTNTVDRKITNSRFYDYFMGIELNPRTTFFDWKLFLNGRPGIVGWSLINISFAAAQYENFGYITNSMLLVNFLQNLYIGYFFYRESWYLKTLDISHDHFGWMFAFGDLVWLPAMYTLQGLYLVNNNIDLTTSYFLFVLFLGLFGFYIFASSNNEKDRFRSNLDVDKNKHQRYIKCTYTTSDGKTHNSKLLISGWWNIARHINYTGDLILSLSYSLSCGFDNIFPYFYIFYLTILLFHRSIRDDNKCRSKYGHSWDIYCYLVPYKFIPGVF